MIASWMLAACNPASPEAAVPAPAPAPSLSISGTITYDGAAQGQAVYVSVRDPAQPGPPLAAKRLPAGPFPLAFTLTDADMMAMGGPRAIPANVSLVVRLDADGDAMTKDVSEPSATAPIASQASGVEVTLAPGA